MTELPPELRYSSQYPWDLIQIDYLAGIIPINDICIKYGVTRGRLETIVRKYGWQRRAVQPTVEEVYGQRQYGALPAVPNTVVITPDEVRMAARDQARLVLTSHRKDIESLRGKLQDLMSKYEGVMCGQMERHEVLGKNESPSDALLKMSQILMRIVGLERQAYGLEVLVDPTDEAKEKEAQVTKSVNDLWSRVESLARAKASGLDPGEVKPDQIKPSRTVN